MLHRILNSLILLPDRSLYQLPADLGLCAEAVAFPNAQGQLLRGFLCRPEAGAAAPVVLFCPGTSGNLSSHLHYVELLCRAGCAVLGFDYTGFGGSAGEASIHTLLTDVLCANDFLRHEKHLERWGIFGVSLGANLALLVASLRPEIRGVAVEGLALYRDIVYGLLTTGIMGPRWVTTCTYNGQLCAPRVSHALNPWRVSVWLARLLADVGTTYFPFAGKDPLVPARTLTDVPVFFIHGVEDPLLPFEGTLQAYQATASPKRLWLIPGVGHAQEPVLARDGEYSAQLGDFFHGVLQSHRGAGQTAPAMTRDVMAQGTEAPGLTCRQAEPPCLAQLTIADAQRLDIHLRWLQGRGDMPELTAGTQPLVSCLRLFEVDGHGETACVRLTTRGQRYQTAFQPLIRALSQTLHEGRLRELEALVYALPQDRPEAPFDFFLGVYCVQIMQRTQRKFPHVARAAAEAFVRYWHYGGASGVEARQPTPWTLASAVLGRQVGPVHTRGGTT